MYAYYNTYWPTLSKQIVAFLIIFNRNVPLVFLFLLFLGRLSGWLVNSVQSRIQAVIRDCQGN